MGKPKIKMPRKYLNTSIRKSYRFNALNYFIFYPHNAVTL